MTCFTQVVCDWDKNCEYSLENVTNDSLLKKITRKLRKLSVATSFWDLRDLLLAISCTSGVILPKHLRIFNPQYYHNLNFSLVRRKGKLLIDGEASLEGFQ